MRAELAIAVAALAMGGCSQPANSLTGSLDEIAPLQFDSVVVRANPQVMVLEYDRFPLGPSDGGSGAAGGTDVVFKMAVKIAGLQLNDGLQIDLTSSTPDGLPRTTCGRSVGQDPRRDLPPIMRGTLTLHSDVNIGQQASGEFHILFAEGGQIGEGRTVDGTFSGVVADANPGSQP